MVEAIEKYVLRIINDIYRYKKFLISDGNINVQLGLSKQISIRCIKLNKISISIKALLEDNL